MMQRRRIARRLVSALLVAPLASFLLGGPGVSVGYAQAHRTDEAFRASGLDPALWRDPAGYAVRQKREAHVRRAAALAKAPKPVRPLSVTREIEEVERRQALHTLGGVGHDLREGRNVEVAKLPAAVRKLETEARRSAVRRNAPRPPPERRFERLKAPARTPRTVAPASWRIRAALDAPNTLGGRLRFIGQKLPRWDELWKRPLGGNLPTLAEVVGTLLAGPTDADLDPTVDAPSDDPLIVRKAMELGHDPVRIFNFVHDTVATELYAGSKKGAVGTLRERAGNDVDQASLFVALLRASGIPARYEVGTVALTPAQANQYAGTRELSVSASLLSSAGIANTFVSLGAGQGTGLSIEHTWVRAWVPQTAYRGIARPGAVSTWAYLGPALKRVETRDAVDLRDAMSFDFLGYQSRRRVDTPVEVYESDLRAYVGEHGLQCESLDDARPTRTVLADALPHLPADLSARRLASLATFSELPDELRHTVRVSARTSQGVEQLAYEAPMAALWGRSVSVVYEPATAQDAAIIASYGGLEEAPAWQVKLRAVLKIDSEPVASGAAEAPGLDQRVYLDLTSPATGLQRLEHALVVGGVYAFALDPGLVPTDLVTEHARRYVVLSGDDLEAQKLYVAALSYFHDLGRARERAAGLHWHRVYKEVEEAAAMVVPRVEELRGVPLRISRDFFTFDAPGVKFGEFSIDGDHRRSVHLVKLVGYETSVLEHKMGERFRGPKAFSAVKLLQVAREGDVPVVTFSQDNIEEALAEIQWPAERELRLRDFANRGFTVEAPVFGHPDPDLGELFGFIATVPDTGVGGYIVGTVRGEVRGAECQNGTSGTAAPGCGACGETGSPVHLLSGNLPLTLTDLALPARGMPLSFTRAYNSRLGWTHNFLERLVPDPDGSLRYVDALGIEWTFEADLMQSGAWLPPPKLYQRVEATADGFAMRFKDGIVHRFDATGRLVAHEDLNGHTIVVEHDAAGRPVRATASGGSFLLLGYDASGHLSSVTDSAGRGVSFVNDARGNIVTETDVLGATRTYDYDASGRMVMRTDFRGNETRYGYDDLGRIVRIEDPLGGVDSYAYDFLKHRTVHTDRRGEPLLFELNDLAKIVRKVDPLGNETRNEWDVRGNKLSETDPRGGVTTLVYDADGNLLSRTDALGAGMSFSYGAFARLTSTTDAAGETTANAYDARGNLLTTTDALLNATSYTYTSDGLVETITRSGGATSTMGYDAVGNVVSMRDAEGGVTTMAYDAAGYLVGTTDPEGGTRTMVADEKGRLLVSADALGEATNFFYDPDGNRTLVVDPEFSETRFEYDALSRLTATTDAFGGVSRQEYDAEGNVTARVDARGHRSTMRYDAVGRLIESCDAFGNCTSMAYCADIAGQPETVVDALGGTTRLELDALGREVSRKDPLMNTTTTAYDLLGRRTSVTDAEGHATRFAYDSLGRLVRVTDALLGVTEYGYDARGNRTSVTDANGNSTTFDYDLADRLVRETTPMGAVTEYGYDLAGNRVRRVDPKGQETRFVYDANERLTDIEYDDGTSAHYGYDARGQRIFEQNADSTREMRYDALGRLIEAVDVESGRTIDYGYDASGHRTSMTVLPDGETTTHAYDARGLMTRMTDPEGGEYFFGYDDAGRRVAETQPNGTTRHTVYDAASRVLGLVYVDAGRQLLDLFGYRYDARGNRTHKVLRDGTSEVYGYDALSRLVRASYPSGRAVEYGYDAVGNRLTMTEGVSGVGPEPCAGDRDCDSVPDAQDNCPLVQNASQLDTDAPDPSVLEAVAAYSFEEASGSQVLDAVGGHHGVLVGGAVRVRGSHGGAIELDGATGYIEVADAPDLRVQRFTLEARVRLGRLSVAQEILSKRSYCATTQSDFPYALQQGGTQVDFVRGVGTDFSSHGVTSPPGVLEEGRRQHIAASYDGTTNRLYVDGVEVAARVDTALTSQNTRPLRIGRTSFKPEPGCGEPLFMEGEVDDVAVYPRALTAEEVASHARTGLSFDRMGDACDACPSSADSTCVPLTCLDADGDGYGPQGASACAAGEPAQFDCDDGDAAVHPGVIEACNARDDDCDGQVDERCFVSAETTSYSYNAFNQLLSATGPVETTTFTYDDNGNQVQKSGPVGTTAFSYDARDRLVEARAPGGTPASCPSDQDCDGVPDADDNCPLVANGTQLDGDGEQLRVTPSSLWSFEEESGTVVEDAFGPYDGQLVNGARRVLDGRSGQALSLDGIDDYTSLGTSAGNFGTQDFAISWWMRTTRSDLQYVMSKRPECNVGVFWDIHVVRAVGMELYQTPVGTGDVGSTTAVNDGAWHHIAVERQGVGSRIYVDGVLEGTGTAPAALNITNTTEMLLGRSPCTRFTAGPFRGGLDEVALYPRALGAAEVSLQARLGPYGDGAGDACDACPLSADPACGLTTCTDVDGDGYGVVGAAGCANGPALDCDDQDASVHPGALETLNLRDDDCDGRRDEALADSLVRYGYDTQGLRVRVEDASGTRRVLLDGIEELAEYEAAGGTRLARYDHDPSRVDALLGQVTAGGKVHAVTDALGSVYGLTGSTGETVSRYSYDVYGQRNSSTEAVATKFGFTGRVHESGLAGAMYYRAREYDSSIGVFLAVDEALTQRLAFEGRASHDQPSRSSLDPLAYGYVMGTPVNAIDPLGKQLGGEPFLYPHQEAVKERLWEAIYDAGRAAARTTCAECTGIQEAARVSAIIFSHDVVLGSNEPEDFQIRHGWTYGNEIFIGQPALNSYECLVNTIYHEALHIEWPILGTSIAIGPLEVGIPFRGEPWIRGIEAACLGKRCGGAGYPEGSFTCPSGHCVNLGGQAPISNP